MPQFTDRLNLLFATFLQPATAPGAPLREWTNTTVVRVAAEVTGESVLTRQHLGMLRSGDRVGPSVRVVAAIADAFAELSRWSGTPCSAGDISAYLVGSAREAEGAAPTDSVGVMARYSALHDPQSREAVRDLIEQLTRQEEREPMPRRVARRLGLGGSPAARADSDSSTGPGE